jgi:hypothetical protein
VVREIVVVRIVEPQGLGPDRLQASICDRIAGSEKRHIMTAFDELLRQVRYDPFDAAVPSRRHALCNGRNLGYP